MYVDVFNEWWFGRFLRVEADEVDECDGERGHTDGVKQEPVKLDVPRQTTRGAGIMYRRRQTETSTTYNTIQSVCFKLENWRYALERRGMNVNRRKTEYMDMGKRGKMKARL